MLESFALNSNTEYLKCTVPQVWDNNFTFPDSRLQVHLDILDSVGLVNLAEQLGVCDWNDLEKWFKKRIVEVGTNDY